MAQTKSENNPSENDHFPNTRGGLRYSISDTLSHMSNEQYVAPGERRRRFEP